jgi:hypothetical protein
MDILVWLVGMGLQEPLHGIYFWFMSCLTRLNKASGSNGFKTRCLTASRSASSFALAEAVLKSIGMVGQCLRIISMVRSADSPGMCRSSTTASNLIWLSALMPSSVLMLSHSTSMFERPNTIRNVSATSALSSNNSNFGLFTSDTVWHTFGLSSPRLEALR